MRQIKQGDVICLTGDNENYNGELSFRAKAVDLGRPPENFVPETRPSRPVPAAYKTVFPEEASDYRQAMMFGEEPLPDDFRKGRFVVFDLETTGLNNSPATGSMDRIIEVGAVKIEDGNICQKFSTFVACPVRLSREIVELTGIDDGMLVGAPDISDVIADFFKFCDGCVLVGHNVQFDYKFIRYYGEREGYLFE
ncbi:MAG: PolC-type DNA polymerase III, partial [Candidatus Gallimonas sp.]